MCYRSTRKTPNRSLESHEIFPKEVMCKVGKKVARYRLEEWSRHLERQKQLDAIH